MLLALLLYNDHGLLYSLTYIPVWTCIRILKKSKPSEEPINDEETFDDKGSTDDDDYGFDYDDTRPDSVDDKVRKKEMRKGIDLATTLERIEKNFVITDPRLPDNPIVRSFVTLIIHP